MNKEEFLHKLDRRLDSVTIEDKMKTLEYYSEAIDDRIEDGLTEEEAVDDLGSLDDIINDVLDSLKKSEYKDEFNPRVEVMDNPRPNNRNNNSSYNNNNYNNNNSTAYNASKNEPNGATIVVLILLFPLWMALGGITLGLFIALWSVVLAFVVAAIACIGGGVFGLFGGLGVMILGASSAGALAFSQSLMAVGGGLIILALLKYVIEGAVKLTKKMYLSIKEFLGRCF